MSYVNGTIIDRDLDDLFSLNNNNSNIQASEDGTSALNYELPLVSATEYASLSRQGYNRSTPYMAEEYTKVKDTWAPSQSKYTRSLNKGLRVANKTTMSLGNLALNIMILLVIVYVILFLYKKMSNKRY